MERPQDEEEGEEEVLDEEGESPGKGEKEAAEVGKEGVHVGSSSGGSSSAGYISNGACWGQDPGIEAAHLAAESVAGLWMVTISASLPRAGVVDVWEGILGCDYDSVVSG